jgi:hypothetical protein
MYQLTSGYSCVSTVHVVSIGFIMELKCPISSQFSKIHGIINS